MNRIHWHVLGAGAMGCLFASTLKRAGSAVTLLLRDGSNCGTTSVQVEHEGSISTVELRVATPSGRGPISHLLVTTKAPDVCAAVLSVAHRLDSASAVLVLANGLGFGEELRDALPELDCFYGTTTEGAYRTSARSICHAGRGLTRIGRPGSPTPPAWFGEWSEAVQPSVWDPCIDQALWLKLAINCAINPLTALHRCPNGDLARPERANEVNRLCAEIMQVSEAAGFADITADLPDKVAEVIRATAENRSSMLQDALAGRPTEIEYITGHLLRVGRCHGITTPLNEAVYRRILDLDR